MNDEQKRAESLAMMIRMLVSSLRKHWPHAPQPNDLPSRAMALLRNYGLQGSVLRDGSEPKAETRQRLGAEPVEPGPKDAPNNRSPGAAPTGEALTDEELARIAYKGFDDYWTEDCRGDEAEAWAACAKAVLRAALSTHPPAVQPVAPAGWKPIETAPKDGRKLILFYRNSNSKARTVMAKWVTDDEAAETDADGVGLEGGWYECIDNWDDYCQVAIHEGEPTHWMPLPATPSAEAQPTPSQPTKEQP